MNEEFINVFIEVMNKKIEEITKNELILQTRLIIAEKIINTLQDEKSKLEASLNKKTSKNSKEDF